MDSIYVVGHKNPDTDSICSAIAYAYLKNQISTEVHEPRRAGHINNETRFVLKYFGVRKPRMSVDASPAIGNIDIRMEEGIDEETRQIYLIGCLVSFYQQMKVFLSYRADLIPYQVEKPLLVFVGNRVTTSTSAAELIA